MVVAIGLILFLFFLSDSRIVSHSPSAYNWQNRFWDNETIVARFPSNKGGNSDILIPCDFTTLCMRVMCRVCGLGPSCTSKQNVLSLILLIPLAKLTNQKRVIYRQRILYPLQLGPPFSNDAKILKPKVGLGLIRLQIDLGCVKI